MKDIYFMLNTSLEKKKKSMYCTNFLNNFFAVQEKQPSRASHLTRHVQKLIANYCAGEVEPYH